MMQIDVSAYPQLKMLCWNRSDDAVVDGREALALFERNWRFVDKVALTQKEQQLIDVLVADYGHGVLLTA